MKERKNKSRDKNLIEAFLYKLDLYFLNFEKLDGAVLKYIALITMAIDHIGFCLVRTPQGREVFLSAAHGPLIYSLIRAIGRPSFPIFAFMLAEGFLHTRDRGKYCMRLFIFALISEIPFRLVSCTEGFMQGGRGCSVIMTLWIAFLAMWGMEWVRGQKKFSMESWMRWLLCACIAAAACTAAWVLKTDYQWYGVLSVLIFYFLRRYKWRAGTLVLLLLGVINSTEWYAAVGIFLIICYNGKKGNAPKWLFYVFYPAHLMLYYLIRLAWLGK